MNKIMYINSVVDYGSTGKIVRSLSNAAIENGYEVCIVYGRKKISPSSETFYMGSELSTGFHLLMTRFFGNHGLHSSFLTKKLINKIKDYKPDIIHLHNLHGYYINVKILFEYLNSTDIRIVWTLHDAWSISSSSANFLYHGCEVWDEGCKKCKSTKDYPKVLFFPNEARNFELKKSLFPANDNLTIVSPSKWLANLISDSFLKEKDKVIINNGVDTDVFNPSSYKYLSEEINCLIGSRKVILGVASVWEKRKGLDFLIELDEIIGDDFVLCIVGLNKKQIKELPQSIIGIQRTNNQLELAALYASSLVFLNPTLDDNFPTTNLESLACGTPVITFNTGGSGEAVSKETGIVVNDYSTKSLYSAIKNVYENSKNLNYGLECRTRALDKFDEKQFVKKHLELYNGILKRGSNI